MIAWFKNLFFLAMFKSETIRENFTDLSTSEKEHAVCLMFDCSLKKTSFTCVCAPVIYTRGRMLQEIHGFIKNSF